MRIRQALWAFGVVFCMLLRWRDVEAACDGPVLVAHLYGSYFLCDDGNHPVGYAYQQGDPAGTNTGGVKIICEAIGGPCSSPDDGPMDGRISIGANWFANGSLGCPVSPSGSERIMIAVLAPAPFVSPGAVISSSGLLLSLSGAPLRNEYIVEYAHLYDPGSGSILPRACAQTIQLINATFTQVSVRALFPPLYTDCDPGTVGAHLGGTCPVQFTATMAYGPVYTSVQPCNAPDPRKSLWTDTGVTPDANGFATIATTAPSGPGQCRFVGTTTLVNGVETGILTGVVAPEYDCVDRDGDGYSTCAGDCDDSNPAIYPGATEVCNGRDDDCDGRIDEGLDGDRDGISDCLDNCPTVYNPDQADRDSDTVGDACDNCVLLPNRDQFDCDGNGVGEACDDTPAIPFVGISFSSAEGRGSGTISWRTRCEADLLGFNVIMLDNTGARTQLNTVVISCEECVTGVGHTYTFIVPKHKSGKNVFVEMLALHGGTRVFGPAVKN